MHPVDLLAPVSPISWDNIALRGVQAPTRAGRDGKRLNSTVYGYTFLLATLFWTNTVLTTLWRDCVRSSMQTKWGDRAWLRECTFGGQIRKCRRIWRVT